MNIDVQEQTIRFVNIKLAGRVDAFTLAPLRERCDALLAEGVVQFVVDLTDVTFLDSAGMAALVHLLKRSREGGGDVRLVAPASKAAMRILELTKFDRVFTMLDGSWRVAISAESA